MQKVIIALLFAGMALYLYQPSAHAQGVITDTLPLAIDGVTRTVTVSYTITGVVAIEVAPITSTFATTATAWLDDLWAATDGVAPGAKIDARQRYSDTVALLAQTETTPYPPYYRPFVRQYRFALRNCAEFIQMHEKVHADPEEATVFALAPYFTLYSACREQYQDAYVEMERIIIDESRMPQ
jgi:hypothetical protein